MFAATDTFFADQALVWGEVAILGQTVQVVGVSPSSRWRRSAMLEEAVGSGEDGGVWRAGAGDQPLSFVPIANHWWYLR